MDSTTPVVTYVGPNDEVIQAPLPILSFIKFWPHA